jgi:hypothetical protein
LLLAFGVLNQWTLLLFNFDGFRRRHWWQSVLRTGVDRELARRVGLRLLLRLGLVVRRRGNERRRRLQLQLVKVDRIIRHGRRTLLRHKYHRVLNLLFVYLDVDVLGLFLSRIAGAMLHSIRHQVAAHLHIVYVLLLV